MRHTCPQEQLVGLRVPIRCDLNWEAPPEDDGAAL